MCWRTDLFIASLQCGELPSGEFFLCKEPLLGAVGLPSRLCCSAVSIFGLAHSQLEVRCGERAAACYSLSSLRTGSAAGLGEPDRRQTQALSGFCFPGNSSHLQHCLFCRDLWSCKSKEEGPVKRGSEQSRL